MNEIEQINEIISETIKDSIKKIIKRPTSDATFIGRVIEVKDRKTYIIRYDNGDREFKTEHELDLEVGDKVHIVYPLDNIKEKFMMEDIKYRGN